MLPHRGWNDIKKAYKRIIFYKVRNKEISISNSYESLSGSVVIPKISLPKIRLGVIYCIGNCKRTYLVNLATSGMFPFKREG